MPKLAARAGHGSPSTARGWTTKQEANTPEAPRGQGNRARQVAAPRRVTKQEIKRGELIRISQVLPSAGAAEVHEVAGEFGAAQHVAFLLDARHKRGPLAPSGPTKHRRASAALEAVNDENRFFPGAAPIAMRWATVAHKRGAPWSCARRPACGNNAGPLKWRCRARDRAGKRYEDGQGGQNGKDRRADWDGKGSNCGKGRRADGGGKGGPLSEGPRDQRTQAAARAAVAELARGLSTGVVLRASSAPCPPCSCAPALSCPACPDCHLECGPGSIVSSPRQVPVYFVLFSYVLAALVGGLFGFIGGALWCPGLSAAGRGPAPAAQRGSGARTVAAATSGGEELQLATEGDFILLLHSVAGRRIWHERMVVYLPPGGVTAMTTLTPDDDSYEEDVAPGGDVLRWGRLPNGIIGGAAGFVAGDRACRFRHPPMPAAAGALRDAAALRLGFPAPGLRLAPNAGAARGVAPAPAPDGGGAAPGAPGGGGLAGPVAALGGPGAGPAAAAGALVPGGGALPAAGGAAPAAGAPAGAAAAGALVPAAPAPAVPPAPPALLAAAAPAGAAPALPDIGGASGLPVGSPGDARILGITTDARGQRYKDFRGAVNGMTQNTYPDWPIRGPRTAWWVCRFMLGVPEHEQARRLLETSARHDQVNVPDVAAAELAARSLQLIEEKYRDRLSGNAHTEAADSHLYYGTDMEWISAELGRECAALTERRKAREERLLARPKGGPKKPGDPKGPGADNA
ncbi:unnamed protein product [Prorocentrum cordatum]|uniref:Uncharacterized protein n=1 Tax=Prorocentrum cordatum TaxID=2364126 RepID=A0ABN9P9J0_9DINO|nr:unnamed protein product [Polarella glacialis]